MSNIKIVYEDMPVGASEATTDIIEATQPFSKIGQLKTGGIYPKYSNVCELNQLILDGTQEQFVSTPQYIGVWSEEQSDNTGAFTTPPVLVRVLDGLFTGVGITFEFDMENNLFPADMDIEYYRDRELLASKNYKPSTAKYFAQLNVLNFNKVVIKFNKMNMPISYLKLHKCDFGLIRTFESDELRNVKITEEVSLISEDIAINSMDFVLESAETFDFIFQKKQRLKVYFRDALQGVFFVDTSARLKENLYEISGNDYIGQMEKTYFNGDIYTEKNAFVLAKEIFGSIPFEMEASLKNKTVAGWLAKTTARNAILQLAFAIGAVVDTSQSESVLIYELSDETVTSFAAENVRIGESFTEEDKATEVRLTEYSYTQGTEVRELFKDSVGSGIEVDFQKPVHNLSIVNGEILSSTANFAVIDARVGCVLSGVEYAENKRTVSIKNPIVGASDLQNIVKFESSTLISKHNSAEIAQKVYDHCVNTSHTNTKLKITNESVGDLIEVPTSYLSTKRGRIVKKSFNLNGGYILAEVVLKNEI